jgi:hypothetical protein
VTGPLERLAAERISFYLCSYSSLDRYFRVREPGALYLATDSEIYVLEREARVRGSFSSASTAWRCRCPCRSP